MTACPSAVALPWQLGQAIFPVPSTMIQSGLMLAPITNDSPGFSAPQYSQMVLFSLCILSIRSFLFFIFPSSGDSLPVAARLAPGGRYKILYRDTSLTVFCGNPAVGQVAAHPGQVASHPG